MKRGQTELTYLRDSVQSASAVGLVIILFDQLIKDLKGAIEAIEIRDIEKRSAELKHGFLVLQQLEESLDMQNGGEAAEHFSRFYAALRASMMEAHVKVSPEILVRQIGLLLDVRQAWQQVDQPSLNSAPAGSTAASNGSVQPAISAEEQGTIAVADWTA
jgi:flagellar secretion chaperone FliS